MIGSPHFTAPEIIRGDQSGKPVDVWAMGVMLYIMLSGQTPFFGTKEHLFDAILRGAYSVRIDLPFEKCFNHMLWNLD